MNIKIKNFYKTVEQIHDNFNVEITRCVIDDEVMESFKESGIVKFIFFDKKYSDISFDTNVNEIHRFKAKYRGNTFIRVPLTIVQTEEDKYPLGIKIDEETQKPDGYVMVSKHDLWANYKNMKYANKEKRVNFGIELCKEALQEYNSILLENIFKVKIIDTNTNHVVFDDIVNGNTTTFNVNGQIIEISYEEV